MKNKTENNINWEKIAGDLAYAVSCLATDSSPLIWRKAFEALDKYEEARKVVAKEVKHGVSAKLNHIALSQTSKHPHKHSVLADERVNKEMRALAITMGMTKSEFDAYLRQREEENRNG